MQCEDLLDSPVPSSVVVLSMHSIVRYVKIVDASPKHTFMCAATAS